MGGYLYEIKNGVGWSDYQPPSISLPPLPEAVSDIGKREGAYKPHCPADRLTLGMLCKIHFIDIVQKFKRNFRPLCRYVPYIALNVIWPMSAASTCTIKVLDRHYATPIKIILQGK